jgi:hypothetical protein
MSKRCKLQKEYYQSNGNYKGKGKYNDKYVKWLEDELLNLRDTVQIGNEPLITFNTKVNG